MSFTRWMMAKRPLSSLFSSVRGAFDDAAMFSTSCAASVEGGAPPSLESAAISTRVRGSRRILVVSHCLPAPRATEAANLGVNGETLDCPRRRDEEEGQNAISRDALCACRTSSSFPKQYYQSAICLVAPTPDVEYQPTPKSLHNQTSPLITIQIMDLPVCCTFAKKTSSYYSLREQQKKSMQQTCGFSYRRQMLYRDMSSRSVTDC